MRITRLSYEFVLGALGDAPSSWRRSASEACLSHFACSRELVQPYLAHRQVDGLADETGANGYWGHTPPCGGYRARGPAVRFVREPSIVVPNDRSAETFARAPHEVGRRVYDVPRKERLPGASDDRDSSARVGRRLYWSGSAHQPQ